LGYVPDRILNWEVALAKGRYNIVVTSPFDFIPFIYTKIKGQYKFAGISQKTKYRTGKDRRFYYYMNFTANHAQSMGQNWWLLQIKPKPHNQNRPHQIMVSIHHQSCDNKGRHCYCPPGSKDHGVFGNLRCVTFDGREVKPICK
jgi:hypothetical protein